jgi:hypothetical protein
VKHPDVAREISRKAEQASMNQYLSVDAAPTTGTPKHKREDRPVAVWLLSLAAAIIAVGAVVCDALGDAAPFLATA